jgi:2-polyprenyl-3-methyl-5-hydroxy-6-metoxy-1,4-benzoquinol methylase
MSEPPRNPQWAHTTEVRDRQGLTPLGLMSNQTWHDDPRRLVFMLARYKFVAKMLSGKRRVLEIGCGDAFGSRIVLQEVEELVAIDEEPAFVRDVQGRMEEKWRFEVRLHDMLAGPVEGGEKGPFDAAYSLDVLEHIPVEQEDRFIENIARSLHEHGVLIIGSPSLESQPYASPPSKAGHVNCKTGPGLAELMSRHFHHVFLFGMNDEVLHTGFAPMAHYRFALCCEPK